MQHLSHPEIFQHSHRSASATPRSDVARLGYRKNTHVCVHVQAKDNDGCEEWTCRSAAEMTKRKKKKKELLIYKT